MMKLKEKIDIKLFWSNEIKSNYLEDFIYVQNEVFKHDFTINRFNQKYINNIYGPSVIAFGYIGDVCVASRAFWRNDIGGECAYQPFDTSVLEKYQGYGIFTMMNNEVLKLLGDKVIIYIFLMI